MNQRILARELHRGKKINFPTRRVITNGIDDTHQIDLVEMIALEKYNKGYKYILVSIDTFSKYVWARKLKSKNAREVADAYEDILKKSNRTPRLLQSDQGTEFFNQSFSALMKKYRIHHYHSFSEKKSSIVERVNRTLKSIMWRVFTERNTLTWIRMLNELVSEYNQRYHSTIRMAPVQVTMDNEAHVRRNFLLNQRLKTKKRRQNPKFKTGDIVRITRKKSLFAKGYTSNFSEELFRITEVKNSTPVTYKIEDLLSEPILGTFYEQEMLKTAIPNYSRVEKVLRRKTDAKGEEWLRVAWKGYPTKFNSWIRKESTTQL